MTVSLLGSATLRHAMTPSPLLRLSHTNLSFALTAVGQFLRVCTYVHITLASSLTHSHSIPAV